MGHVEKELSYHCIRGNSAFHLEQLPYSTSPSVFSRLSFAFDIDENLSYMLNAKRSSAGFFRQIAVSSAYAKYFSDSEVVKRCPVSFLWNWRRSGSIMRL